MFKPIYTLFFRKYWFDELYENLIVKKALIGGLFAVFQKLDASGVDGIVNGIASGTADSGDVVRRTQTGQLQLYGLFMGLGAAVIAIILFIAG